MRCRVLVQRWSRSLWRNEQGTVLVMALVVMVLLMGVGSTALFSGYTNLLTSNNLKLATRAKATAEASVNEALYRLSRQETDPAAIVPNLSNPNWQVEIDFTSGDSDASDGEISTIQPIVDWPDQVPAEPVIVRYKKPDPTGSPNTVLFYDRSMTPPFRTIALPAANIPDTAHPVIQIVATALDDREAERQLLAEAAATFAFSPPAPLSSGVDVDMHGAGFIDGVNHDHRIYVTDANGNAAIYGDDNTETTDSLTAATAVSKESPDSSAANLMGPLPSSPARIFNKQTASGSLPPTTPSAWVGVTFNSVSKRWTGINDRPASPVAFSNGPVMLNDGHAGGGGVWRNGLFSWGVTNGAGGLTMAQANPPPNTPCSDVTPLPPICRPPVLNPFPMLQAFLGLDDVSFQQLLDNADTTKADLDAGQPPLGFTYIEGNHTFNNNDPMPGNNDFGLMYVTGNLMMNGGQRYKGLIYVDGDLDTTGDNVVLGAVMVRGITETDASGTFTLLYSRKAAELGIQAGRPWRVLSWTDTAMQ